MGPKKRIKRRNKNKKQNKAEKYGIGLTRKKKRNVGEGKLTSTTEWN